MDGEAQINLVANTLLPCAGLTSRWATCSWWDSAVYWRGCGLAPETANRQGEMSLLQQYLPEDLAMTASHVLVNSRDLVRHHRA